MNAPASTLPQWKIDLVREAIKIIEGEKGRPVTAAMIARRIPSLSMADIEIAMTFEGATTSGADQPLKKAPPRSRG